VGEQAVTAQQQPAEQRPVIANAVSPVPATFMGARTTESTSAGIMGNSAAAKFLLGEKASSAPPSGRGNSTNLSITPSYARSLSDNELAREISALELSVGSWFAAEARTDGLRQNLRVLWGERNRRRPDAAMVPPGGEELRKFGVVAWAGQPELHLRTLPQTTDEKNVICTLPFNTSLQVMRKYPGNWYFVSTRSGELGYAGSQYIKIDAPEPNARLHRVESGITGTAIAIAEHYYRDKANDWGQDLRFYVNVLAWANRIPVPNTTDGWRAVQFQADRLIWVPSQPFARSLKGIVNSGSLSYNAADALGIAGILDRLGELLDDFEMAVKKSTAYMGESIRRHVEETLWGVLQGLAQMLAIAAAILAISTAVFAGLGSLAGGIGAAPGAAVGFEVGMALLEWLGLAMLAYWVGKSLVEIGGSFASFFATVWGARGDESKIDKAAHQFAEAIGILLAKLLEALLMWVTSKGLPYVLKTVGGTKLGQAMGESKAAEWLTERSQNVASGKSLVKSPGAVFGRRGASPASGTPAEVTVVGDGAAFHSLPAERLPANLPDGHFWSRSAANEWVILREPGAPVAPLELAVYADAAGNMNYALRTSGRTIATDALTRTGGTYASGQQRLPQELGGTGANNPYRDPATGELYDKSHGVDYADTLEGPGVRSSTTDPVNFTPGASWWNRGPRNALVQQIRAIGGGYRELPIYDAVPRVTANGTPIPREFVFVETSRAGVPQRAWRIPNDPALTDRSMGSLLNRDIPIDQVPQAILRPDALVVPDGPGVTYLPGMIIGRLGDDEKKR